MHNVVFEVITTWKDELSKATDPNKKGLLHDDGICYLEWKLATPDSWDIDEIKETLENFSSLMGKFFRIEFVYKGSLVIQTSAQLSFLQNDDEFQLAVESFLKDFLDICNLDTDTKTIVKVKITISNEKFESKYVVSKKIDPSWLTCDPCSTKNDSSEAIQFCSECQHKLCRQCMLNHNLNAEFFGHHLTDIATLSFENFCVKHEGRILDYFCVVHDCLCCPSCKVEDHNSCQKMLSLEDASKDVKHSVMFQDVYNSIFNITTTLNKAITSQDVNKENLDHDEAAILGQLASNKAKIIKRLDELEGLIILETSSLKKAQNARIDSHENSLLQMKKSITKISRKIDQECKYGSQYQLFVLINKYKLEIIDIEIKFRNMLPNLMTRSMKFQPREHIQNTITSLGSTRLNILQYKANYKQPNIQQVEVRSSASQLQTEFTLVSEMPTRFTLNRRIEIKQSKGILIRSMCITNTNRLLLCNTIGTNLLVYNEQGDYLQDCKLSGTSYDIAVIPDEDKAVVTLPKRRSIQFIDIKTMKAGSTHSVPKDCWNIAIANDKIYVGGYLTLHILDKQGNSINKVNVPNVGHITDLHPGPDESVYYIDIMFNAICCVTIEGEQRFRYTSSDLHKLNAVTTDKKGNLYVACESLNTIQRITPKGKLLDSILNAENDINRPTDISFGNDYRKLFVLNHVEDNTNVLVFSCS
ncbi:uncharacterized protein [Mytilus edulis]|uniref:uncharacterized protein n=1 Tax=Mytilus edulis TaxID=6550 RepID=UPI0039EE5F35